MDLHTIRRLNLKSLLKAYCDGGAKRQHEAFAKKIGVSSSQLSQLTMDPNKPGSRNLGNKLAGQIESNLKLEQYYLDNPDYINMDALTVLEQKCVNGQPSYVMIEVLPQYYLSGDKAVFMTHNQLQTLGLSMDGSDAAAIQCGVKYMSPSINYGDLILVKTTEKEVVNENSGDIFAFEFKGRSCLSRLYLNAVGSVLCSMDTEMLDYHKETRAIIDTGEMNILGRVVWRSGKI